MSQFEIAPGDPPNWSNLEKNPTWTRISGGQLESPIYVRIVHDANHRPFIDGMVLGAASSGREITANTLRSIQIGAIISAIFEGFSLDEVPACDDLADQIEWGLMHSTYILDLPTAAVDRLTSTRGAGHSELETFARVYTEQLAKNGRRAMTATAQHLSISRATANRRAEQCRAKGLLPAAKTKRTAPIELPEENDDE